MPMLVMCPRCRTRATIETPGGESWCGGHRPPEPMVPACVDCGLMASVDIPVEPLCPKCARRRRALAGST